MGQENPSRRAGAAKPIEDLVPEHEGEQPSERQQGCKKENFLNHKGLVVARHITWEFITRLPGVTSADMWKTVRVQWSIDSADAYSVANVRRRVIEEVRQLADAGADLFALEIVLGELLAAETERGHWALAVSVERDIAGPTIHLYAQGAPAIGTDKNEFRRAILLGTRVPLMIEASSQGTHMVLRMPPEASGEAMFRSRASQAYNRAQEISRRYTY